MIQQIMLQIVIVLCRITQVLFFETVFYMFIICYNGQRLIIYVKTCQECEMCNTQRYKVHFSIHYNFRRRLFIDNYEIYVFENCITRREVNTVKSL